MGRPTTENVIAIAIIMLIYTVIHCVLTPTDWIGAGSSPRLLDWESVQHKLPWNVVIVLGSGFALAAAAEVWLPVLSQQLTYCNTVCA